jgi:hypothetical protein
MQNQAGSEVVPMSWTLRDALDTRFRIAKLRCIALESDATIAVPDTSVRPAYMIEVE